MTPDEMIRDLVNKLLAKTRAREVLWKFDAKKERYVLRLTESSVELGYRSPTAEPDFVFVTLNRLTDGSSAPVGRWAVSEGEPDWETFHALYDEANRVVLGWDKVLGEVQSAVNAAGPIGQDA